MDEAILPYEVFEEIFKKCDAKTLTNCEKVCRGWTDMIQRLDKTYKIWDRVPLGIPENDYLTMKNKLCVSSEKQKEVLVKNWAALTQNGLFKDMVVIDKNCYKTKLVSRITCLVVSGDYYICGNAFGALQAINFQGKVVYEWSTCFGVIKHLHLFDECEYVEKNFGHRYLLVNFPNQVKLLKLQISIDPLFLEQENMFTETEHMFRDIIHASFFQNYVAILHVSGYLTVKKIVTTGDNVNVVHVKSKKFYNPHKPIAIALWNNLGTFITNTGKAYHYSLSETENEQDIIEYMWDILNLSDVGKFWIFNNEVIFQLSGHILQLFYYNKDTKEKVSAKFNVMKALNAIPTCVLYYVCTLFVGTSNGWLYMYNVKSWADFKLSHYKKKLYVSNQYIHSIDIQELELSRIICVGQHEEITILSERLQYPLKYNK